MSFRITGHSCLSLSYFATDRQSVRLGTELLWGSWPYFSFW